MICNGRAVLCVQVGVDFVKDVEGRRVSGLDGEDQGETAKTYCFERAMLAEISQTTCSARPCLQKAESDKIDNEKTG